MSEEAGESAPCPASHSGEVMVVSFLPGSLLWAGLTQTLLAAHAKFCVSLLEWRCQSWLAPGMGKEGKEGRVGKQMQGRPQRAGVSPQGEVSGEQGSIADLTPWQQL